MFFIVGTISAYCVSFLIVSKYSPINAVSSQAVVGPQSFICPGLLLGLPTLCFAIPGHLNIKNSKFDVAEAYETR